MENSLKTWNITSVGRPIVSDSSWTIENIEAGFEQYFIEYGHYPNSRELDEYKYLPTRRYIERNFGGIQTIRKTLRLKHEITDNHRGKGRSDIAQMAFLRANKYEEEYYDFLIKRIPPVFVHEHKVMRNNGDKTDTDFFIYTSEINGFAIDLFFARDLDSLRGQINIKLPKYQHLECNVYFISVNKTISQDDIEKLISAKKTPFPTNIFVYEIDTFNNKILPNLIKSEIQLTNILKQA